MEIQSSFADIERSGRRRVTKREQFLRMMNGIIPWDAWISMIKPFYPDGMHGRPVRGIETMLRMYLLQVWFSLSDEGGEDAICDSDAMRRFVGVDFFAEEAPDATTLLKFRHMPEKHKIGEKIFADVRERLIAAGLMMQGGTIVDATIIHAPSSTKNKTGKRDPEMHQVKKGNEWHFGMKVHVGVDAGTGYVHTITGTAANEHDSQQAHKLIRKGEDEVMYGDSVYLGVDKQQVVREAPDLSKVEFRINKRPTSVKEKGNGINREQLIEKGKSSVRSKVEHLFLIVKRQFGYSKVVYRGLAKNMNRFNILFASANLLMCARAGRSLAPIVPA